MYKKLKKQIQKNGHGILPGVLGLFKNSRSNKKNFFNIDMSLRVDGEDVSPTQLNLPLRFQEKSKKIILFVHGLMDDEKCWQRPKEEGPAFGKLFEEKTNHIVLYIRYNTGLHISTNGKKLNKILNRLELLYGDHFNEIDLVGHSMGGLILRSTGHYGEKEFSPWIPKLKSVFLISVPSYGSFVEQFANATSFFLSKFYFFHVGWIGKVIDLRSDGIKDLRLGYMVDEDWDHPTRTNKPFHFKRTPITPIKSVKYHLILGNMGKTESSIVGKVLGDGMVHKKSAIGKSFFMDTDPIHDGSTLKEFSSTGHISILNKPEVFEYISKLINQN